MAQDDAFDWLTSPLAEHSTDLAQTLEAASGLVSGLLSQYHTTLSADIPSNLPPLAVHPVALRQILLNLLSIAIHRVSAGVIALRAQEQSWYVEIQLQATSALQPASPSDQGNADILRELTQRCGGQVTWDEQEGLRVHLLLPAVQRIPILAVDDSADTLQLLERYAAQTRYQLLTTREPEACFALAEKHHVQAIFLDVMMPQVDGWDVLGRLRNHPSTAQLPVIVCSILHQQELALTLGADAFMHKPISRGDFLAALDRFFPPRGSTIGSSSE